MFDSWGPLQPLINVRDRINRGETIGSRTFIAGNIVGLSGPFGRDFNVAAETTATKPLVRRINRLWEENTGPDLLWNTPDQVRREMKRYISRGIDFLKYAASGHREEDFLQFSPERSRRSSRSPPRRHHRPDAHDLGREPASGDRGRAWTCCSTAR